MAVTTAAKLNNSKGGELYYIGFSRGFCAPSLGVSFTARLFAGLFESFPDGFTRTHKEINELLGMPSATITRGFHKLKDINCLTRTGMSTYTFKQSEAVQTNKGKWYCPLEVITREFEMTDDAGNKFTKKLTPATCNVYGNFYTKLSYEYKKKGSLEFTYKELAAELDMDEGTVAAAISYLRWAKIIYFPKSKKGVNGHKKSVISLNRKWGWFKKEKNYRKRKSMTKTAPQPAEITREEYYAGLQVMAQKKADKALKKALKNKEYRKLNEEITSVRELYIKSLRDVTKARELSLKIDGLDAQRIALLESIGLNEEHFKAAYYAKCKCCNDTGWKPDMTACDCFNEQQRGSPPGDGKKEGRRTE